jgi:Protein of unknown function (DUF3987)
VSAADVAMLAVQRVTGNDAWPEPDRSLVRDDRSAPPAFDWDAVPGAWQQWIADTAADCGAPPDYVFAGLLAIMSAAIGNARRVSPWGGWVEPPHLWFALVGNPSAGKTPALRPLRDAARELEKAEEPAYEQAMARHERDTAAAAAQREKWEAEVKAATKNGHPPPDRPTAAVAPTRPPLPRLVTSNVTVEALAELLAANPKGVLLDRDELAGLIGQFDKYGGSGDDRAFYLETWNGGRFVVDRKAFKGVPLRVQFASLAIVGGIQPDRLHEIHNGTDDGLAARFLYVWPEPVPPCRPTKPGWDDRRRFLEDALARLRDLALDIGEDGEQLPRLIPVPEPGLKILDSIRNEVAAANREDSGLMAGWRGKTPGRLLRLGLVLEYAQWAAAGDEEPDEVSEAAMRRAADYLDYLGTMFERVLGDMAIDAAARDAAQIGRWIIANRVGILNGRDLSKERGLSRLRKTEARRAAFQVLVEAAWIREAPASGKSGRRPDSWCVNPSLFAGA